MLETGRGAAGKTVSVLVVDDSALMRTLISDVLQRDDDIEVVDVARDGEDALAKIKDLNPDVLTLDVEMPRMNGLELLMELQGRRRPQAVMLSGVTDPDVAYRALELGAVDFVVKPSGSVSVNLDDLGDELRRKVRAAATVAQPVAVYERPSAPVVRPFMPVVVLAASTGGPMALERVVGHLTREFPAAVVIVQHLPTGFSASLAQRLDRASGLKIMEAENGQNLLPGHGYLAPAGTQLRFKKNGTSKAIVLSEERGASRFAPSADVTLTSLAEVCGRRGIGVVMTGMGSDGLLGMRALHAKRGRTIAQDEETSVIFGMPKACIDAGVVGEVLPVGAIGERLAELVSGD
ncbi:MAG: chemotaxis response regulator protein-glutamate methylesterase [Thermoleophilia bacterium]